MSLAPVAPFAEAKARQVMSDLNVKKSETERGTAMKLRVAESGFLGLVKPDSAPRRLWRSDELLDRFEDGGELTRVLPIARPFPKRTMQSIQRRPRTLYSSEQPVRCLGYWQPSTHRIRRRHMASNGVRLFDLRSQIVTLKPEVPWLLLGSAET